MTVTLFANGILPNKNLELEPSSMIIAADGGARHCLNLGIVPQVVIGDFDSLTDEELADLEKSGAILLKYPDDKNETDLELALNYILEIGATKVKCYGLLGGRWDMSISNILLLASSKYLGIQFQIIDANVEMYVLRSGSTLELTGNPGEMVSVIPLETEASGINYKGMAWPLANASLFFGSPRGVSNRMTDHSAQISLDSGVILVIHYINQSEIGFKTGSHQRSNC